MSGWVGDFFMPLLLLAFFVVFLVASYFWRRKSPGRGCRWRKDNTRDKGSLSFYHCVACGAEAYTATNGPPKDCKSNVTSGPL